MNWPGAWTIFERLSKMPFSMLEEEYSYSKKRAKKDNNTLWLMTLDDFKKQIKNNTFVTGIDDFWFSNQIHNNSKNKPYFFWGRFVHDK